MLAANVKEPDAADNSSVFAEKLQHWGRLEGIYGTEAFMIGSYFEKHKRTLEAGCGGGRLLLGMHAEGFTYLSGFDYLPEFIRVARERDASHAIDYRVLNAINLDYPDASFDQLMYMQQVLCFLPSIADQRRAIAEAYRIARPGATLIACVLAERARRRSRMHRAFWAYLSVLRTLTFSRRSIQFLPWMRYGDRFNYKALLDRGPYVYWFKEAEIVALFEEAGFRLIGIGTEPQIAARKLLARVDELRDAPFAGGIYLACQKPAA